VLDEWSRECQAVEPDAALPGESVVRVLKRLCATRGMPAVIQSDNGPEFRGRVARNPRRWSRVAATGLAEGGVLAGAGAGSKLIEISETWFRCMSRENIRWRASARRFSAAHKPTRLGAGRMFQPKHSHGRKHPTSPAHHHRPDGRRWLLREDRRRRDKDHGPSCGTAQRESNASQ